MSGCFDVLRRSWASRLPDAEAIVWRDRACSYGELVASCQRWRRRLRREVPAGTVVGLRGDFSPGSIAALVGLADARAIVVPLPERVVADDPARLACAGASLLVRPDGADTELAALDAEGPRPELYAELARRGHAGLIVFTSGSSGTPKGIVHDLDRLLLKFETPRAPLRTIAFLLFDHLGGLNTALHTLSSGGTLIVPASRRPDDIGAAVERHRAELLPATPTFLNLLLAGRAHRRHDMRSLHVISYGAEAMPQRTLVRLRAAFPDVDLRQTYGLAEAGVLRVRSRPDGSLWMRVGGEGVETRVVDGVLQLRAPSVMLGYLGAESPVTADGWLDTGDVVDVDGDEIRVLGRRSDLVKVAGELVAPAEIEGVIEEVPGVLAATVAAEPNPMIASLLVARVQVVPGSPAAEARARVLRHCVAVLPRHKVPVRIVVLTEDLHGERFKKRRSP